MGARRGHIWTLCLFVLVASGCLSNAGTPDVGGFDLPRGATVHYVVHEHDTDAPRAGVLQWDDVGPALDAFGEKRSLLTMTDGNRTFTVDPDRRMIPVRLDRYGELDFFMEFDRRGLGASVALADLLLLGAGRDWDTHEAFIQRWQGRDLTVTGSWDTNVLTIHARGDGIPFDATFTFVEGARSLATIDTIDVAWQMNGTSRGRSFDLEPVDEMSVDALSLPTDSTRRESPLATVAMEAFLDGAFPPMAFDLEDAWETLTLDPRMAAAMDDGPWLHAARYQSSAFTDHQLGGMEHEWLLKIQTESGALHQTTVQQVSVQDTVVSRRVTAAAESGTAGNERLAGYYSWSAATEICEMHTQTQAAEVTDLEFMGSLRHEFHRLHLSYRPADGELAQVQCAFDTIEGRPVAAQGLSSDQPLCIAAALRAGGTDPAGRAQTSCLLETEPPIAHRGTKD